ncbi:TIGR00730 family Rossman fold protein [Patescibacteria group bacterium]|nr:TIGR00730 family Rossman fold protein [Patescibacteria group bacterium]MBU1029490.1 TIGR00730 family Rossman fold protein [Patescibacteria group bacterium]
MTDKKTRNTKKKPLIKPPHPHQERKIPGTSEPPPKGLIDFRDGASWKIFRIMSEFTEGFEFLADLKKEVSFFGSARIKKNQPDYKEARKLARMLGKAGFTIITGGGPGIMEAANHGATDAGAESVGLNIQLPREQRVNPYVKHGKGFYYFFTRKVMLSASAQAYIYFPGGFGTLDELFEIITLIQTGKMMPIPIVLVGKKFWEGLFKWSRENQLTADYLSEDDYDLFSIVDTAEEAFELLKDSPERPYF